MRKPLTKLNWNQLSDLGLMERINREILHPLGLAVSRTVETGVSDSILIAGDGVWEYDKDMPSKIRTDKEVRKLLSDMIDNDY